MTKPVCSLIFLVFLSCSALWGYQARAQNGDATVRGIVTAASDGEPLLGVNIVLQAVDGTLKGSVTDGDGLFIVTRIPVGTYRFQASFIGFETYRDTLQLRSGQNVTLAIALETGAELLEEVLVETEREAGAARITAGLQTIQPADIELVPAPDISGDLVTSLTTMPGVVSLGDRGGQLFVRGGEPAHNQVMLDGMYVYQPFHILGFYSAFPADILSQADVYAGGYGSKYSGRISSVMDIRTRTGNKKTFSRTLSLSPFTFVGMIEGPIVKDKASFIFSVRPSVIDRFASKYVDAPLPYNFGDVFGKAHFILNENHQVSFTGLHTWDEGSVAEPTPTAPVDEVRWKNTAVGLRYVALPRDLPFLAEVLVSYSWLESEIGPKGAPDRSTGISGVNTQVNITNFTGLSQFNWGFFLRSPEITSELGGLYQNINFSFDRSTNVGAYFEPDLYLGKGLRVRLGLVAQIVGTSGLSLEPRFRAVWELGKHLLSASGGVYRQELVGLNDRRDATNIFTAWTGPPENNRSQAIHAILGYRVMPVNWLELSVEGFYKWLDNLYVAEWTPFPRFTTNIQEASGRSKGVEMRVEVRKPGFYAFANYALSSVEYTAMQESLEIWFGTDTVVYRPPHDRRHQFNVLFSAERNDFNVSIRWQFGSGLPYNQVRAFDGFILMDGAVDVSKEEGASRVIYDIPFGGELPPYHRLDLSGSKTFRPGKTTFITLQAGIINVYNRANLFALDVFTLKRTDQLPIIPTLGIKFEW